MVFYWCASVVLQMCYTKLAYLSVGQQSFVIELLKQQEIQHVYVTLAGGLTYGELAFLFKKDPFVKATIATTM